MPRYFFHIVQSGTRLLLDEEGDEFTNLEMAKNEAVESIRELVIHAVRRGESVVGLTIEIVDETGQVRDTIRASEALN